MKKIILTMLLFSGLLMFGQDIKTKKGKIIFDKIEIAKFSDSKKWYTIYDLEGNEVVKIKPNIQNINENSRIIYYEVSSPDGTINVSLFNKSDKSPLSLEKKMLIDFTLGDYKLFTSNGLDKTVVDVMLTSNLNVKDEILAEAKLIENEENRVVALLKQSKVTFNDNTGQILRNNRDIIGTFKRRKGNNGVGKIYEVFDKDNNPVAIWYSMISNVKFGNQVYPEINNQLILINNKVIMISGYKSSENMSLSMDDLAAIILGNVLDNNLLK